MSSSPIPLKTSLFIYTKGAKQSWLTGTVSNKSIQLSTSKTKALKLVAERAGNYYTLRVYGIKKYLAAGNPSGAAADCTAVFTTNPKGMEHHWNIVTTSTGMRISTVQPCTERGKRVVQFLKVVPSSSGGHLELASKDSDIFFSISANSSGPGTAPTPRPVTGTPAPSGSTGQLKIQSAPQIPKIITIEPYNRPGYFLGPKSMATNENDGSLQVAPSRVLWYTDATSTTTSISMRAVQYNGPSLGVNSTCASPILSRISGGSTRFIIGTVSGYNGFIIRTSTVCNDNKYKYLVIHTNGSPGVSSNAPTSKTIQQHLWRFSIGATQTPTPDITIAPITRSPTTIPPVTYRPTTTPTPDTFPPLTPAPTFQPTVGPVPIPTIRPVPTLTAIPTYAPTESPTFAPTEIPTFAPTERPTLPPLSPTPSPTNSPGGGSGPININIDAGRPDRVVFPYPVTPDLLLANPDGSLNATGGLMTDAPSTTPTALPSETALPDGDLILPQFEDGESEENSDDEGDDETVYTGLWTTPVILISILVLLTVFIGGYYLYNTSQSTSTNTSSGNAGGSNNALTNTLNNSLNAPLNTGTPNLGGADTFGDGFNDFANVENIGPPPPTTTTR